MSNILKINSSKKVNVRVHETEVITDFHVENEMQTIESQLKKTRELGFEEGKKAAIMELQAKYENDLRINVHNMNSVIEKIDAQLTDYEKSFEKIVIETAFMISEKIIREKIEQKTIINEILNESINKVLGANKFIAKLNPQDFRSLNDESKNMLKEVALSKIKFENDESIEPGGCFIETDIGNADGRISSQLNELKKAFENKLFADESEDGN